MVCSAIYKQWGYVVNDFEEGFKAQQEFIAGKSFEGSEMNEYDAGWLFFWESGLLLAKACQRTTRFQFLKNPLTNEKHLLLGFLVQLTSLMEKDFPEDTSYRSGMMDALDSNVQWVVTDISSPVS